MLPSGESALIAEAQRGSAAAFEELVRRYDRGVLRLALNLVRSEEEARDIYQESFLKVYRALGSFRFESGFQTWLFRIVTNVCLDRLRRASARPEGVVEPGADHLRAEASRVADGRPDHDPERSLARKEMRRRIDRALEDLAPRERLVFELRHHQGMRLAAIGQLLKTSEDTVKNCLFRAHRSLRAGLSDLRATARPIPRGGVDAAQADIV